MIGSPWRPLFEKLTLVLQLKIMESSIEDHGGDVEKSTGFETRL
jgi:hypothetical protein